MRKVIGRRAPSLRAAGIAARGMTPRLARLLLVAVAAAAAGASGCRKKQQAAPAPKPEPFRYPLGLRGDAGPWRGFDGYEEGMVEVERTATRTNIPSRVRTTDVAMPSEQMPRTPLPPLPVDPNAAPAADPTTSPATAPVTDATTTPAPAIDPTTAPAAVPLVDPVTPAAPAPAPSDTPAPAPSDAPAPAPAPMPATEAPAPAPAPLPSGDVSAAAPESRPTTAAKTYTGTLQGGINAIGGETTGWRLAGDGATGGIDVDVSAVEADAKALDGKRVTITGRMTERQWPERGKVQVLVAERIEAAKEPKANK